MKTAKKVWIIIAVCLIVAGGVICTRSLNTINFNFKNLVTEKFISNEYNITENFSNIKIDVNTTDIDFVRSQTDECMVVSIDTEKVKYNVSVENDTLLIAIEDNREWYDHIGIFLDKKSITVYLPVEHYDSLNIQANTSDITISKDFTFSNVGIETDTGDVELMSSVSGNLDISTDTGDIKIQDVKAQNITHETDTGKTYLTDVYCDSLVSSGSTGDIKLTNVIAIDKFNITRSTGDVTTDKCDAGEIFITTDTGDVSGSFLTSKIFITNTDTGDVSVPKTTTGGNCQITTSTGDINIKIKENN